MYKTADMALSQFGGLFSTVGAVVGTAMSVYSAIMAETDIDRTWAAIKAVGYASGLVSFGIGTLVTGIVEAVDAIVQLFGGPAFTEIVMDVYDVGAGADGAVALIGTLASGGFDLLFETIFGGSLTGFLAGLFGPSAEWKSFGTRLEGNLKTTGTAIENLWKGIDGATSPEALQEQINQFIASIAQFAGGFGKDAKPFEIPTPPGATGTEHEGGFTANFEKAVQALRDFVAQKLLFFQEPLKWFEKTVNTYMEALAEVEKTMPTPEYGKLPIARPN